jgi:hypothetical protein
VAVPFPAVAARAVPLPRDWAASVLVGKEGCVEEEDAEDVEEGAEDAAATRPDAAEEGELDMAVEVAAAEELLGMGVGWLSSTVAAEEGDEPWPAMENWLE